MSLIGLDSAFPPDDAQLSEAYAAGVRMWSGYAGPYAYHDWSDADFARVRAHGMAAIMFVFPGSDPVAMATLAKARGVFLCLDNAVGDTPNPYAASVESWLHAARAVVRTGMYGQKTVLEYWHSQYDFAVSCGITTQVTNPLGLSVPCGNQYERTHTEFGASVDRGVYDDFFESGIVESVSTPVNSAQLAQALVAILSGCPGGSESRLESACDADATGAQLRSVIQSIQSVLPKPAPAPGPVGPAGPAGPPGASALQESASTESDPNPDPAKQGGPQ